MSIKDFYRMKKIDNIPYLDKNIMIPISTLSNWIFCNRQVWMEYFSGLKVADSEIMKLGTITHNKKYDLIEATKEEIKEDDELNDLLIKNNTIIDTPSIPVISIKNNIYGRTDKIYFNKEYNMIEEFKPNIKEVYNNVKIQIFGYALAFNDMYNNKKEMRLKIINKDGFLWTKIFTLEDEKIICSVINEVKDYLLYPYRPNRNKMCGKFCRYYNLCNKGD